jgi:pimeloyl-ACP methyl ester carboxylesterase
MTRIETRRTFLKAMSSVAMSGTLSFGRPAAAQVPSRVRLVDTKTLMVAFEESGDPGGAPVILLHGWPDDVRAWDAVVPALGNAGYRVIVPYLRGFGATRFREPAILRGGEQAALSQDVVDLADALQLPRFAIAGYDWGNRAACIVAALHPQRVNGGVFIGGYTIQDTVARSQPAAPERERALWYQWYFNTERGRTGLAANRRALCRLLWETWSPTWRFSDETFDTTAASFDNPDFVDVTIHSYRHRIGAAPGEARFIDIEQRLARRPLVTVPAIVMYGAADGVAGAPPTEDADRAAFSALLDRQVIEGAGHFLPREAAGAVSAAVMRVLQHRP